MSEAGYGIDLSETVMKLREDIDPRRVGRTHEGLKRIPRSDAFSGACLQAYVSFTDTLSGTQRRRMVVEENLGRRTHHQQRFCLGQRQGFALIQLAGAAGLPEKVIKGCPQRISLGGIGIVWGGQQISRERPEVPGTRLKKMAMSKKAWHQLLVVAIVMDPAEGQLDGSGGVSSQPSNSTTGEAVWLREIAIARASFTLVRNVAPCVGTCATQYVVELALCGDLVVQQPCGKRATPGLRDAQRRQPFPGEVRRWKDGIGTALKNAKPRRPIAGRNRTRGGRTTGCRGYDTARLCHARWFRCCRDGAKGNVRDLPARCVHAQHGTVPDL